MANAVQKKVIAQRLADSGLDVSEASIDVYRCQNAPDQVLVQICGPAVSRWQNGPDFHKNSWMEISGTLEDGSLIIVIKSP